MQANFLFVLVSCLTCFGLREKPSHSQWLRRMNPCSWRHLWFSLTVFTTSSLILHTSLTCVLLFPFPFHSEEERQSIYKLILFLTLWSFGILVDLPTTILIDNSSLHHIKIYSRTVPCYRLFFKKLYIHLHIYLIMKIKQTSLNNVWNACLWRMQ